MNTQKAAEAAEEAVRTLAIEAQREAMVNERTRCMGIVRQGGSTQEMCNKIMGKEVNITNHITTDEIHVGIDWSSPPIVLRNPHAEFAHAGFVPTFFFPEKNGRECARINPDGSYTTENDMTPEETKRVMEMALSVAAGFLKERQYLNNKIEGLGCSIRKQANKNSNTDRIWREEAEMRLTSLRDLLRVIGVESVDEAKGWIAFCRNELNSKGKSIESMQCFLNRLCAIADDARGVR